MKEILVALIIVATLCAVGIYMLPACAHPCGIVPPGFMGPPR